MSEINKLLTSIEKTSTDIEDVKTRVSSILGKLHQLKQAVQIAVPASGSSSTTINTDAVKKELEQAKTNISKFKDLLKEAATSSGSLGGAAGADSSSFELLKRRKQIDDKNRSLFERLGGDLGIETTVELMYSKALLDPRLRAFFEKNSRKMQTIRDRMSKLISTITGGPKTYDMENLKPTHYHLNVTDYAFDAILELFGLACQEMGLHVEATRDFVACLGKVRRDITIGCTVRMELARQNVERDRDHLYHKLGGDAGIGGLVDRLFELLKVDPRLRKVLQPYSLSNFKAGLRVYLTELFGGAKTYKGRSLEEIHARMRGIDDYAFDCFLQNLDKALNVVLTKSGLTAGMTSGFASGRVSAFASAAPGVPKLGTFREDGGEEEKDDADAAATTVDEVIVTLESLRAAVLGRQRGLLSKSKLVDGKSVLERLGGELALEGIVETVFSGASADPRLKSFFLGLSEARTANWKLKMNQLLLGLSGGASNYDVNNLKSAHYALNIQDFHVDAILEHFAVACDLVGVSDASTVADFVQIVQKVRPALTAGCTVRWELARHNRDTNPAASTNPLDPVTTFTSIYTALGGDSAMEAFITELYKGVDSDERIAHFFQGSKAQATRKSQAAFIITLFGSPVSGATVRDLDRVHSMLRISDFHFDAFMSHVLTALRQIGAKVGHLDEASAVLDGFRLQVVKRSYDVAKAVKTANEKSLYERLGGETGLTKLIDGFYDRALQDERLKSFFEKNRAKIISIKKRMTMFVTKICGGPSSYDASGLRQIHYNMNIADFHYDVGLDLFYQGVVKDLNLGKHEAMELMRLLQPIRAEVTTGYTVRSELARRNLAINGKDQLFVKVGKNEGVKKIIDALYELVLVDSRIKHFFANNAEKIKVGQTVYITELLGGNKVFKGRELVVIHATLGITDYHFDAFLNNMHKAMTTLGFSEVVIDEVLVTLEPVRSETLSRTIADGGAGGGTAFKSKMKDGKKLIERMGGEMNLEAIVEGMYDRLIVDPRVRFAFEKSKARMRQIRTKMYEFVSGLFGGVYAEDVSNNGQNYMRSVHENMNVGNEKFDVVVNTFAAVCREYQIEEEVIDDALFMLNRVRADVTTGWTVRSEVAKASLRTAKATLYAAIDKAVFASSFGSAKAQTAGQAVTGVGLMVDRVYELIAADKRINMFFEGAKVDIIKTMQTKYLAWLFGGPQLPEGIRPLPEIHAYLAIQDYHFECFIHHIFRALKELGVIDEHMDQVAVLLEGIRRDVVTAKHTSNRK